MLGIGDEISVFLQAFLSGGIVFFAYCCIRVFRRLIKHNLFFVSAEDIIFWIGTGIYLFAEMYDTSAGSIRWFFVIGALSGGLAAYGLTASACKIYEKFRKKKID